MIRIILLLLPVIIGTLNEENRRNKKISRVVVGVFNADRDINAISQKKKLHVRRANGMPRF